MKKIALFFTDNPLLTPSYWVEPLPGYDEMVFRHAESRKKKTMIQFDLPQEQSSIIKVIGVGGGGSNAVNHMYGQKIEGVNFIICNTDAQAISQSKVPNKIQLGPHLTQGLGAGANPEIGRQATEESLEEIRRILEVNTKMAFITAGMGGGTGTGGAPILAKICKDLGILTVGIVTTPFAYEGKKRLQQAKDGIDLLKQHVDTLLVISNDKLRHQFGNLKMKEAFGKADNVLATAAKCITDVINTTGQINVDFADVCTVMRKGGSAILGNAYGSGENRAQVAIEQALNSPLLNDSDIRGARWILININSAEGEHEFTMDEVEVIQSYVISRAGEDSDVIMGMGYDETLGDQIGITIIATGFQNKDPFAGDLLAAKNPDDEKIVMKLELPEKTPDAVLQPVLKPAEPETEPVAEIPAEPTSAAEPAEADSDAKIVLQLADVSAAPVKPEALKPESLPEASLPTLPDNTPVFLEISSAADQVPVIPFDVPQVAPPARENENPAKQESSSVELTSDPAASSITLPSVVGGYLAKPKQVYAGNEDSEKEDEAVADQAKASLILDSVSSGEVYMDMQIVEREPESDLVDNRNEAESISLVMPAMEETPLGDENEEVLKKRAAERIARLRNLSFNVNSSDPNSDFETIPAYMRRNMELHNSLADVETFYSNYTVKADAKDDSPFSKLNSFLDGKKPD
jgi:cell division protein FtsZ